MKRRIILPIETINYLKNFGTIDDVVNHILSVAEFGEIQFADLPICCDKSVPVKKITVYITNQWYNELYIAGEDKGISLKRLIQHFVDNDMFDLYPMPSAKDCSLDVLHCKIDLIQAETRLLRATTHTNNSDMIARIKNIITDISTIIGELQ